MKQAKAKMPLSLRLMLTMLALVAGMIGLAVFLNNTFLEKYYTYRKQQQILENYQILSQASDDRSLYSSDFDQTFERMCLNGNFSIMISERMTGVLLRGYFGDKRQDAIDEMLGLLSNANEKSLRVIREEENYVLSIQHNKRMGGDQMVLLGQLAGGENVYMRTAIRSIEESAAITNRFFLYTGILTLCISCLVIYLLSRSISKPLQEIQLLSKRMSELDFEAKYQPKTSDTREIAELGQHMNEMSQTIEQTVSELKSANLELQRDIARKEEIDDMRKEFLSNVSHELKTPLALIQGYAEGLQECINDDPESRAFYCDVIMDETEKMNHMVQKLLTLNNLEFGSEQPVMERFDLTELCQGLIASASLLAEQDGIRIIFHHDQPCYVWGDSFRFEEVITNYLSNAIHHCSGDCKEIHADLEERDGRIRLKVFNYGANIPEEDLDRIWIKFYKVDKARTREYGGSGIGLSIVKAIMDSMKQECGVRNCRGGVEFWAELEKA